MDALVPDDLWAVIEPLLPFATSVDIYLKGRGLPSFYAVKLPDLTFVLGLSGWTEQNWTGIGSFDLLNDSAPAATASAPPPASAGAGEDEEAEQEDEADEEDFDEEESDDNNEDK